MITITHLAHCPTHGLVPACGDVENGHCPTCSDEFHRDLVADCPPPCPTCGGPQVWDWNDEPMCLKCEIA